MIIGKSIEEIIQTMKTDGPTSIGQLEELHRWKRKNIRRSKKDF